MRTINLRTTGGKIIIWSGIIIMLLLLMCNSIQVKAETPFEDFPETYRMGLQILQKDHPNWKFVPVQTGLDWNTAVLNEVYTNGDKSKPLNRKSAIGKGSQDSFKYKDANGNYSLLDNSGNWFLASEEGTGFYMNPVNYLDDRHIFAFEELSYNPESHTLEGVEGVIRNSWMNNRPLEDGSSGNFNYSNVILQAGIDSGVSPYHLASRIIQEQGSNGTGALISGDVGQYSKYGVNYSVYNYYNINASGVTKDAIISSGLQYAVNQNWTNRFAAIQGGAIFIGKNYINRGQDTLYLQKFDVDNSDGSIYRHQYMQNIQAPYTESEGVYKAYLATGAIDGNFVFKIPVYNNMPNEKPSVDEDKARSFVTRLYNVCLDREPDTEGLNGWTEILSSGRMTGSQVAYSFIFSDEFKSKNYCNECFLKQLYKAFMGREYDDGGLKYWMEQLQGGMSREAVFYGFAFSDEFVALCLEYNIEPGEAGSLPEYGTIPTGNCAGCGKKDGVTEFVERMYSVCLDREPDPDGLAYHCGTLRNHSCSGRQVASNFVFSDEFKGKGYSDEEFVEYLYRVFMGREFDEGGKTYWVGALQNGETKESVFERFGACDEFVDICNGYGIAN